MLEAFVRSHCFQNICSTLNCHRGWFSSLLTRETWARNKVSDPAIITYNLCMLFIKPLVLIKHSSCPWNLVLKSSPSSQQLGMENKLSRPKFITRYPHQPFRVTTVIRRQLQVPTGLFSQTPLREGTEGNWALLLFKITVCKLQPTGSMPKEH